MKRAELTVDQTEETNGGMYQGYGGVERPGIMSKGMGPGMLPRGPGMMGPSYYNTPQYVPEDTTPVRRCPPDVLKTRCCIDGKPVSYQEFARLLSEGKVTSDYTPY